VDPRGIGPRPLPCHGSVIPFYYGPSYMTLAKIKFFVNFKSS
jgi:hypothetical protein